MKWTTFMNICQLIVNKRKTKCCRILNRYPETKSHNILVYPHLFIPLEQSTRRIPEKLSWSLKSSIWCYFDPVVETIHHDMTLSVTSLHVCKETLSSYRPHILPNTPPAARTLHRTLYGPLYTSSHVQCAWCYLAFDWFQLKIRVDGCM